MASLEVMTALGNFRIQLLEQAAPETCAYFADVVTRGLFRDGSIFRIVSSSKHGEGHSCPIDVVQVGTRNGFTEQRTRIRHEHSEISHIHHERWTVSAARFEAGELYSSFFICLQPEPGLDFGGSRNEDGQGFAAFGRVVSGQGVIEQAYQRAEESPCLTALIPVSDVHYAS